jgi:hypothetical protein
MKVGDTVFQDYQSILRFGVILELTQKSGWSYATIKWFDDEVYERAMSDLVKLRKGEIDDFTLKEYRIDMLKVIDLDKQLSTLTKIQKYRLGAP